MKLNAMLTLDGVVVQMKWDVTVTAADAGSAVEAKTEMNNHAAATTILILV